MMGPDLRLEFNLAPEDKEKGLGSETRVHYAQDSVIIDLAKDVIDWQGIVDHRR